jgi:hypothetical protein
MDTNLDIETTCFDCGVTQDFRHVSPPNLIRTHRDPTPVQFDKHMVYRIVGINARGPSAHAKLSGLRERAMVNVSDGLSQHRDLRHAAATIHRNDIEVLHAA